MKIKRFAVTSLATAVMMTGLITMNVVTTNENNDVAQLKSWYSDYKINGATEEIEEGYEGYHNQANYYPGNGVFVCTKRNGGKIEHADLSMGYRVRKKLAPGVYSYGFVTAGHGCDKSVDKYAYSGSNCKNTIGKIEKVYNYSNVDASYIRLIKGQLMDRTPLQDIITPTIKTVNYEDKVTMHGAVSGRKQNKKVLLANDTIYDGNGQSFDVIVVEHMSKAGDSGAIVYKTTNADKPNEKNYVVGIVKGEKVSNDGLNFTYVMPAKRINKKLGVECY